MTSNEITLRFPLTKGDGELPGKAEFSEEDLSDMRTCFTLDICWDPDEIEENQDVKIISFEILYDGVTHMEDEEYGYWFNDDELCGYPAPIIRFKLDHEVDIEQFRRSMFTTSFTIFTDSMEESFLAEDHNGYTSSLSEDERDEEIEYLKENNAYCGKVLNFSDGLPEGGYSVEGTEFILTKFSEMAQSS